MALRCCLPPDCHFSQASPRTWLFSLHNCCFVHTLNLEICSFPPRDFSGPSQENLASIFSIGWSHVVCIPALSLTDPLKLRDRQIWQIFFLSALFTSSLACPVFHVKGERLDLLKFFVLLSSLNFVLMEINMANVSYWGKLPMMHLLLLSVSDKHAF